MRTETNRLSFVNDYMEGGHPTILERFAQTNFQKTAAYGQDSFSEAAREKIRAACDAPAAEIHFLLGGTQANATVIDALLRSYQGVISADTGHISLHEAGAIEFGGHKILTLPHACGKISAAQIGSLIAQYRADANHEHMVMPGMVYLSQPTEYGTLYSLRELRDISRVCHANGIPLYLDGARLAYALASAHNDVSLSDLAALCDVFYIGGTKCGALFGEAVVIPQRETIPHFFTIVKQHGALLAKGRMLGLQFDALFTDGLYARIGTPAILAAQQVQTVLRKHGLRLLLDTPTNQVFCIVERGMLERLSQKVEFGFWEDYDETHCIIRFATSWAANPDDAEKLDAALQEVIFT